VEVRLLVTGALGPSDLLFIALQEGPNHQSARRSSNSADLVGLFWWRAPGAPGRDRAV